jgi:hypothetical protein
MTPLPHGLWVSSPIGRMCRSLLRCPEKAMAKGAGCNVSVEECQFLIVQGPGYYD